MNVVSLLRSAGLTVRDERVRPRPGDFHPVGVMNHHTAGAAAGNAPSLGTVKNGRGSIPGPLCNVLIGRDGVCFVITDGRANDSGMGSSVVLKEVRADRAPSGTAASRGLRDDTNGNPWFFDLEIENRGNGRDPYPAAQREAVFAVNAALCRAQAWPAERCIGHLEWTKRKPDPRGLSMRTIRAETAARLRGEDIVTDKEMVDIYAAVVTSIKTGQSWSLAKKTMSKSRFRAFEKVLRARVPADCPPGSGSGLTIEDVKAAVRQVLRDGVA